MPFIETKAKSRYEIIDGKRTHVITPECEITLTNMETGKETILSTIMKGSIIAVIYLVLKLIIK